MSGMRDKRATSGGDSARAKAQGVAMPEAEKGGERER